MPRLYLPPFTCTQLKEQLLEQSSYGSHLLHEKVDGINEAISEAKSHMACATHNQTRHPRQRNADAKVLREMR